MSRFGGEATAVGRTVRMNNVPVTIVGVISPEFTGIQQPISQLQDIGLPVALDAQLAVQPGTNPPRLSQPTYWWLEVVGRLKPGVAPPQVQANLETVFQHTARVGLDSYLASLNEQERSRSSNANRTQVPHLLADSGSRGVYEVSQTDTRSVA